MPFPPAESDRHAPWIGIVIALALCVFTSKALEKNGESYCDFIRPLLFKFEESLTFSISVPGCGDASFGECFGKARQRWSHKMFGTPCEGCEEEKGEEGPSFKEKVKGGTSGPKD